MSNLPSSAIRHPQLTGEQDIVALWFPADWFNQQHRLMLILKHWQKEAQIYRFEQGDLLCYRDARRLYCEKIVGWPMIRLGRTYCSAPLETIEIATLPPADVWLVRSGQVEAMHFSNAEKISLSNWIDIEGYDFQDTYDCYDALILNQTELLAKTQDVRTMLGDKIPPASNEQQQFLQAAKKRAQSNKTVNSSGSLASPAFKLISGLISKKTTSAITDSDPQKGLSQVSHWQRWLAKLAMTSGLSSIMGRQHANYIRRMMEMFESDDIENALRHALPLGSDDVSQQQMLGRLQARQNLNVNQSYSGSGAFVGISSQLQQYLQQLYRQQFTRLDQAGRIDEALFVLAELLQVRQEALDYLEKHQRYQQAAELARSWRFPTAQIIRLYCCSGDWQTAVTVARLENGFASAVLLLEPNWPDAAKRLRVEWAQSLAEQGKWLDAVDAVWRLPEEQHQAQQWLLNAESAGGQLAARALVTRSLLLPDTLDIYQSYLSKLIHTADRYQDRAALAVELLAVQQHTPASRGLAKGLVRTMISDQFSGHAQLTGNEITKLIALSDDKVLKNDLPQGKFPSPELKSFEQQKKVIDIIAPEAGLHEIHDAAVLLDQRYLVALGEAGAAIVNSTGQIVSRYSVPAYRIVLAHSRQVALVLTRRDEIWLVNKLDLVLHTVTELGMVKMDVYAQQFDGIIWSIAEGNHIRVVDVERNMGTLWQVNDLPGNVTAVNTTLKEEQWLIMAKEPEFWRYSLPERRLTARDNISLFENSTWIGIDSHNSAIFCSEFARDQQNGLLLCLHSNKSGYRGTTNRIALPDDMTEKQGRDLQIHLGVCTMLIFAPDEQGQEINLYSKNQTQMCASIHWPEDSTPNIRMLDDGWLIFDRKGRLLHLDWHRSGIRHISVR